MVAADHLAVHDGGDAGIARADHAERVEQVALGVRAGLPDRLLCTGQDDRLVQAAQHVVEQRGGIGQGIGAMGDDKAVKFVVGIADQVGDLDAVVRSDVGRILGKQVFYDNFTQAGQFRQEFNELFAGQRGRKAVSVVAARHSAARCDQQDMFESHRSKDLLPKERQGALSGSCALRYR